MRNHNGAHVLFGKITSGNSTALSVATVLLYTKDNQVKFTQPTFACSAMVVRWGAAL